MTTTLPISLRERVEYASPSWISAASEYASENPVEKAFKLAARYTNPPPHLASEPLELTITLGPEPRVDSGFDEHADFRFEGDYTSAQVLHSVPSGETRLAAEYERLFGDRRTVTGEMPDEVETRGALVALMDHMAKRTVNNPDIRHRAGALGIESNLVDLDKTGYTVLPEAFSSAFADDLRTEAHKNHSGREEGASFRATMLLERGRIWEEVAIHPWVLTLAEYLLGRGCLIYQSDTIVKGPGLDTHPGLHADYGASRIPEPFPDYCLEATAVWAIDDFKAEHGPTVLEPGSFRKRTQVPAGTTQEGTKMLEMDEGSIAFWHGATWHGSTPRKADGLRTSLHNAYSRGFVRTIERYEDIDAAILARNPPAFTTLCGLDDPFGKSGLDGADFERMGYCAGARYGSSEAPSKAQ